ncbi:Glycosyltransferase involved in cell wall bisynthesis [Carboxydocella thermautotrophica]|nr:Glycosyltransferase involved in cell wall bisynthesis [Carboxydocella thermautotrophica]
MKNKILLISPLPPPIGGISIWTQNILNSKIKDLFIHINTSNGINANLIQKIYKLYKYIFDFLQKINKVYIVHINTSSFLSFYQKSIFVLLSKIFKKKVILHIHSGNFLDFYNNANLLFKIYIKKILLISDRVAVLSNQWEKRFKSIDSEIKTVVLPNWVEMPKEDFMRNYNSRCEHTRIILYLGSIIENKGIHDLIKAIFLINNNLINFKVLIAGAGKAEYVSKCKKMVTNMGLVDKVHFINEVSGNEKYLLLRNASIFVLPSYYEGMPLAMLEAMSFGLPIIATKVGSIPEVIEEEVNGFLFEEGDAEKLAQKILYILNNYKLAEQIGKNNIEKISKYFSDEVVLRKFEELYYSLQGGNYE